MTWLLANTIVAAAISVVVLAIGRWLKPAPAIMHGLWLVVLLKLVTPPLFEVPVDVTWWTAGGAATAPVIVPIELTAIGAVTLPPTPSPQPPPVVSSTPAFIWWLWGSGSAVLVLFVALGAWRMRRRLRGLGTVAPALRAEVEVLAARLGVRVPKLCSDAGAVAPYLWSLGPVRLMLPGRALLRCSKKGRAAVLAHELAHLRRGDHWVARVELTLAVLLWWHPLFWFARNRLRLWGELACDSIAVCNVPDASLDYATVLVDAAARPDSTVPGLAVLASRPAARAAFERRLTMILNENYSRRTSPIWCVPFAMLAVSLFAVPVAAQGEREPVRIEVRINGERVDQLSKAQQKALLEVLLGSKEKQGKSEGRKPRTERRVNVNRITELEGMPSAGELRSLIDQGLQEARREISKDKDLRELGITDEVLELIDGIAEGKGIESQLDGVVRAAMKGAGKMVIKELKSDKDLQKLGIADGIGELVIGFLENERNQEMVGDLAHKALGMAIREAKQEIRSDEDLKKLGITKDVESLIDSVLKGGNDFEGDLERIIQKAMKGAMREIESELGGSGNEEAKPRTERRTRRSRIIR